jgi:hypothetical protein
MTSPDLAPRMLPDDREQRLKDLRRRLKEQEQEQPRPPQGPAPPPPPPESSPQAPAAPAAQDGAGASRTQKSSAE